MARRIDRSGRVQMTRLNWAPIIAEARVIVESYDTPVTLRQLFYRLVARQLIPHPPGHRGIEIVVAGWQSAEGPRPGDDVPTVDDIHRIFLRPTGAASKAIPAAPGPGDLLMLTSKNAAVQ